MGPRAPVWPWRLLLGVILLAVAAALWVATERVDYTWRWNRVPQYFAYRAETVHRAPFDGTVEALEAQGSVARVTLRADGGETATVEVAPRGLRVDRGDLVFEGDAVGSTFRWRAGPLAWGLWTTIWISFVSGALGLVLGLATGLCRIARNPTLRGLSSLYVELIRGTPLLVQIFIFYFFIGTLLDLDRIVAGVGALALFAGAYVAEIVRAGIQSIPRGQMEAARS
ncbi:MAG: amino acid ABC transporter permease, partial [Deferrisomatales bacterium]